MKNNIIRAVTPAIIALAAVLLSLRSINADTLIGGLFCVVGLCAIMALDYRVSWKRWLGR